MSDQSEEKPKDSTIIISNAILFMLSLLVLNEILINYFNQLAQRFPMLKRYINNTMLTTLLGLLAGVYLILMDWVLIIGEYRQGFSQFFLIVLLPPILFESAVNMEKTLFFQNFGTILSFAIFGTALATTITAILMWLVGLIGIANALDLNQSFAFGALISATDPVAVLGILKSVDAEKFLYILIYGESILNDAIGIIAYQTCGQIEEGEVVGIKKAVERFTLILVISILIGFMIGVICAYILKIKAELTYQTEHIEVSVTIIIPWVCYLIAEAVGFSGIVSIVFCGIAMARYALPNLSESGKQLLNKFYNVLAYNFENLVFLFIGIGMIGYQFDWEKTGPGLVISAIIIVQLGRLGNIKGISFLLNLSRHDNFIKLNQQNVFWFCGLRGAMAYALALDSVNRFQRGSTGDIILTMTMTVVFINIFIHGSMLVPYMERYCVAGKPSEIPQHEEEISPARGKGIIHRLKDCIEKCDEKVLQEFLTKKRDSSPTAIKEQEMEVEVVKNELPFAANEERS